MKRFITKRVKILRLADISLSLAMCAVMMIGGLLPFLTGADSDYEGTAEPPAPTPVVSEPQSPVPDGSDSGPGGSGSPDPGCGSSGSSDSDPRIDNAGNCDAGTDDGDAGTDDGGNDFGLSSASLEITVFTNELPDKDIADISATSGDIEPLSDLSAASSGDISGATITITPAGGSFEYNGSAITPSPSEVTVNFEGNDLTYGTDYDFVATDNTNAGTATLTVQGKGIYSGTETENFVILTRYFQQGDLLITPDSLQYNGPLSPADVSLKPAGSFNFGSSISNIRYEGVNVSYGPSGTAPTDTGIYRIIIDLTGTGNFAAVTNLTVGQFTITPREITLAADNKSIPLNTDLPVLTFSVKNLPQGQGTTDALLANPTVTGSPTHDTYDRANPGEYPITLTGGTETVNYVIVGRTPGILTVEAPETEFTDPGPGLIEDFEKDLSFTLKGIITHLIKITLEGHIIQSKLDEPTGKYFLYGWPDYDDHIGEMESGSVLITLYSEFINSLEDGEYKLQMFFSADVVIYADPWTTFIIDRSTPSIPEDSDDPDKTEPAAAKGARTGGPPQSGDNSNTGLWVFVLVLSIWGILSALAYNELCRQKETR